MYLLEHNLNLKYYHEYNVSVESRRNFWTDFGRHARSHVFSQPGPKEVALMNGFLCEERLNSRVTVPEIPCKDRRSDFDIKVWQ